MHQVKPRLFLSGWKAASDEQLLADNGITHVVNASGIFIKAQTSLQVLYVNVDDYEDADISQYFTKVNRFMHNAWLKGETGVLVHCFAGQSRSVALVVSYLAQKHKMSYNEAIQCLIDAGVYVGELNSGFERQLERRIDVWEQGRRQRQRCDGEGQQTEAAKPVVTL